MRSEGVGPVQNDWRETENRHTGAGGWSVSKFPSPCFYFLSDIGSKCITESKDRVEGVGSLKKKNA